jgi:hypothetical protein
MGLRAVDGPPAVVEVLDIDELMAVKMKSPGGSRSDSPWNDPSIGFPAMCQKTAKRRLARSMPLNVMQQAARMDEAVDEQGAPAWISPDKGVVIDGEFSDAPSVNHEQRGTEELLAPRREYRTTDVIPTAAEYAERWRIEMQDASNAAHGRKMAERWNAEKIIRDQIEWPDDGTFERLQRNVRSSIETLKVSA